MGAQALREAAHDVERAAAADDAVAAARLADDVAREFERLREQLSRKEG